MLVSILMIKVLSLPHVHFYVQYKTKILKNKQKNSPVRRAGLTVDLSTPASQVLPSSVT